MIGILKTRCMRRCQPNGHKIPCSQPYQINHYVPNVPVSIFPKNVSRIAPRINIPKSLCPSSLGFPITMFPISCVYESNIWQTSCTLPCRKRNQQFMHISPVSCFPIHMFSRLYVLKRTCHSPRVSPRSCPTVPLFPSIKYKCYMKTLCGLTPLSHFRILETTKTEPLSLWQMFWTMTALE